MNDAVLQILLILAYLAIGLISVTFPIYAISVDYLRQEKWESGKERKKRLEEVKGQIAELARELSGESEDSERFHQINDQIGRYKSKKESLEYLTARGAVMKPIILLALALLASAIGILFLYSEYAELESALLCGALSGGFSAVAIYRLYRTISAVEVAALRPARTIEFRVDIGERGKTTHEIKLKQEAELKIAAGTTEEDLENVEISVFVPPEIEFRDLSYKDEVATRQPRGTDFPNYMGVTRNIPYVHRGNFQVVAFRVIPKKVGTYEIPVQVFAKGVYEHQAWLTLRVVK